MKKLVLLITIAINISLIGCSTKNENDKVNDNEEIKTELAQTTPIEKEVDYSDSFNGIKGTAVYYSPDANTYNTYNKELINEQIPPYSTFKISPIEQVKVLETIFEGKSSFEANDVELVKEFMLVESNEDYSVHGKTGSAKDTNAWFVGFIEKDAKRTYFAVRIADESQKLAGSVAKEIALSIINKYYK